MLLKTINGRDCTVADPGTYPAWTIERYNAAGIEYVRVPAEDFRSRDYDECWIYNVLQHVRSPREVIDTARVVAPVIRIFEWIDLPPYEGHLHELRADRLDYWLRGLEGHGTVAEVNENGADGRAYYGVFGEAVGDEKETTG